VSKAILSSSHNNKVIPTYTNISTITKNNTIVAVKTHIESVRVEEFKALLCELKIQAYLGQHPYILKFIGACTENIKQRQVYMVVEYCANGNLKDFLEANRKYFIGQDQENENSPGQEAFDK
jgi:serine/threonine protein kinase